jgi:uncharacterized protein (DUF3084 family)
VDFLPIAFLLLIVLVSGGIAYLADELGRKLGKKRLTIFKVRPRDTAKFGVVISGMVVSLLTIVLIVVLSSDVRAWIVQGRRAIKELKDTRRELDNLRVQQQELSQQGESLNRENRRLSSDNAEKAKLGESQAKKILAQRKELEAQRKEIQSQLESSRRLEGRVADLDQKLRRNREDLKARQQSLRLAQRDLSLVRQKVAQAVKLRDEATAIRNAAVEQSNEVKEQNLALLQKNADLEKNVKRLGTEIAQLERDTANLTEAREKAQEQLKLAQDQLVDLQAQLQTTERNLNSTQATLNQVATEYRLAQSFYSKIGATFTKSREMPLIFRGGQEVVRVPLSRNLGLEQAKAALESFLRSARARAAERGAEGIDRYAVADIFDHVDKQTNATIPSSEIKARIAQQVAEAKEDVVLVAYSTYNAFKGEPVSLEVGVFPNPMVYRQGQVLAESAIDGKRDQAEIFSKVSEFLGTKVNERAKQDRMLPRAGTDEEFGSITAKEILDLVGRVRAADRRVTLRAMVDSDTRAADPLKLRFGIR